MMPPRLFVLAIAGAFALSLSPQRNTTQLQRIPYRVACSTCKLTLVKVAELEHGPTIPLIGPFSNSVRRDSRGRIFTENHDQSQILVFSPEGKFLAAVGRSGDGPGELSGLRPIEDYQIGRGDSLFVFHRRGGRVSIFSPGFAHVRELRIPDNDGGSRLLLDNGRFVIGGNLRGRDANGHQFHVVLERGEIVRSFGGPDGPVAPGAPRNAVLTSFEAAPDRRSLWGYRNNRLQHWSVEGELLHDFELLGIPWFATYQEGDIAAQVAAMRAGRAGPPRRASPSLSIAGVDSAGMVWIRGGLQIADTSGATVRWRNEYYIDVFDPTTRTTLLSQKVEMFLDPIPGSNLALGMLETDSGEWRFTIYRVSVTRR